MPTFSKNGHTYTTAQIVRRLANSRVDFAKSFAQQSNYAVGDLVTMAHEVGSYTETKEFFAVLKRSAAGIARRAAKDAAEIAEFTRPAATEPTATKAEIVALTVGALQEELQRPTGGDLYRQVWGNPADTEE